MGGQSSRPQASANEMLKYACDVAIASNAACISQAQATIVISITGAANVTFKNVNLSTTSTASTDCSQSININVPNMQNAVTQAVKQLAGTKIDNDNSLTELSTSISKAMNQANVQKAIGDALDSYKISLKATGNVDLVNFDVSQVATSNLHNIVQNMSVSTGTGTDTVLNDVQKKLDAAMTKAPSCPKTTTETSTNVHYAPFIGLLLMFIIFISSFVFLGQKPMF